MQSLAILLLACVMLPEHARPHVEVVDPSELRAGDPVRYRKLAREDFLASAPPAAVAAHAARFGAFTCANVVPEGATRVRFDPGREPGTWVGRLENTAFHAEMDRACSWWNPAPLPVPSEYVLEHEQIHFALTELHARRLGPTLLAIRLPTSSQPEAAAELERRYEAELRATMDALVRESTAFDEDTSNGYEPARQSRWRARVEAELAKTPADPDLP